MYHTRKVRQKPVLEPKTLARVEITRLMVSICTMQVCACEGATDAEILDVCNSGNPAGITGGWRTVIRQGFEHATPDNLPIQCTDHPDRTHFLVLC